MTITDWLDWLPATIVVISLLITIIIQETKP